MFKLPVFTSEQLDELEGIRTELSRLRHLGIDAMVAGGYVRDLLLNRESKDIDYFILNDPEGEEDVRIANLEKSTNIAELRDTIDSYMNVRENVTRISKTQDGMDYIHMCGTILEAVEDFDSSICQAWISLEDNSTELNIYATNDFLRYSNNGIIYFYSDIETTENHINRVKTKFPDAKYMSAPSVEPKPRHITTL